MTGQQIGYIRVSSFDQHRSGSWTAWRWISPLSTRRLARCEPVQELAALLTFVH